MHKLKNNHTAPLYLPYAGGLEGIMLPVGETPIDDKLSALLDALADGPPDGKGKPGMQLTVKRWLDAGLLEFVVEVADGPTAEELAEAEAAAKLVAEEEAAAKAKAEADAKAAAEEAARAAHADAVPAQPVADLPPLTKTEG